MVVSTSGVCFGSCVPCLCLALAAALCLALAAVSPALSQEIEAPANFHCSSETFLGGSHWSQKGLAVDDTTMQNCSGDIPKTWPNSGSGHEDAAGVRSLRLFKAWSPAWPPEGRLASWKRLVKYIHQNDVLLLLGTSISCDVESDKQQWEWAKELMKMVGKRHILALAIGNEVEYLH
ncbi:unnamed protein product, partial [Polarella glacialis]